MTEKRQGTQERHLVSKLRSVTRANFRELEKLLELAVKRYMTPSLAESHIEDPEIRLVAVFSGRQEGRSFAQRIDVPSVKLQECGWGASCA